MPTVEKHNPGQFCWVELATTDAAAAKSFYSGLFGWEILDQPMGPDMVYTTLKLGGRAAAALYTLTRQQLEQGIPSHWMLYVATASADAAAGRAAELGGQVLMPPFDVMDFGRMAVLRDPAGAVISVWEAKTHVGIEVNNEIGAFGWGELATRDTKAAAAFYTQLFGWGAKADSGGMPYTEWQADGRSFGGMMEMNKEWGEIPPHWMPYFMVANCDATVAKAAELKGEICVPATDIPKVGRFSVIKDPAGAAFSVIQLLGM